MLLLAQALDDADVAQYKSTKDAAAAAATGEASTARAKAADTLNGAPTMAAENLQPAACGRRQHRRRCPLLHPRPPTSEASTATAPSADAYDGGETPAELHCPTTATTMAAPGVAGRREETTMDLGLANDHCQMVS